MIDGNAEHNHLPALQSGSINALLSNRTSENMYRAKGGNKVGEPEDEYEPEPTICCICDKPIEGDDMQDRYWLHEIGCDFYESGSCDCDLECHADCYKGHESEYLEYDEEG